MGSDTWTCDVRLVSDWTSSMPGIHINLYCENGNSNLCESCTRLTSDVRLMILWIRMLILASNLFHTLCGTIHSYLLHIIYLDYCKKVIIHLIPHNCVWVFIVPIPGHIAELGWFTIHRGHTSHIAKENNLGHEVAMFYILLDCNHSGHVEVIPYILQNGEFWRITDHVLLIVPLELFMAYEGNALHIA